MRVGVRHSVTLEFESGSRAERSERFGFIVLVEVLNSFFA